LGSIGLMAILYFFQIPSWSPTLRYPMRLLNNFSKLYPN
jgi:hypothetical protein